MSEWMTSRDVAAFLDRGTDHAAVRAARRRLARWRADGFPLVEERARGVGGVELVVRRVELEAYLGLRALAADVRDRDDLHDYL